MSRSLSGCRRSGHVGSTLSGGVTTGRRERPSDLRDVENLRRQFPLRCVRRPRPPVATATTVAGLPNSAGATPRGPAAPRLLRSTGPRFPRFPRVGQPPLPIPVPPDTMAINGPHRPGRPAAPARATAAARPPGRRRRRPCPGRASRPGRRRPAQPGWGPPPAHHRPAGAAPRRPHRPGAGSAGSWPPAGLLIVALVATVLAVRPRVRDGSAPPAGGRPAPGDQGPHRPRAELPRLLAKRAKALLAGDRAAFLATVDRRQRSWYRKQATLFERMRTAPFSAFAYRVLDQRADTRLRRRYRAEQVEVARVQAGTGSGDRTPARCWPATPTPSP